MSKKKLYNIGSASVLEEEIKIEECIVRVTDGKTIRFYFKNHGISIETENNYNVGDTIQIEYTGEIGNKDFKYKLK